ncbi:MAG: hypothetical protein ABSF84_07980 [Acidimicrobiales bacterium]
MKLSRTLFSIVATGVTFAACGSPARSTRTTVTTAGRSPTTASSSVTTTSAGTPTTGSGAQDLPASDQLRAELLTTFAASKQMPESYFTGPQPGTLYYAYLPSTRTYWALAHFGISSAAPSQTDVDMQDGGDVGVFSRRDGGAWTMTVGGEPFPCPGQIPDAVMTVWGMTPSGACEVADASSPSRSKLTNPAVTPDLPAGVYFGTLLSFDLHLDGTGSILFEPETWQGGSLPVSHSGDYYFLDFGPSTTAAYWVGSSAASSHEVTGHFDSAFAQVAENAMVPFATQPYSGYVIQATVPTGCTGACSELASITQFGPLTPKPPNPDYAEPSP